MKKLISSLLALALSLSLAAVPAAALTLEDAKQLLSAHYVDGVPPEVLELDSLDAILEALGDPYTFYMTPEQYQSFEQAVNGRVVVGIGATVETAYDGGYRVMSVLPDSPALEAGVHPVLTLTPFGPDGNFNSFLITAMVNSEAAKDNLLASLLATLQEKDFRGVDIDFEYIRPEDRIPFADFVAQVRDFLSPYGYHVSVALAPKTSDTQTGTLYEGMDYRLLGEAADSVLLMTYEWGYTYGPPMAVAPLNKVRQVVEYALTRIPPSKIDLGIPNYGYDWTLPFVQGSSRASTVSNLEAVRLAIEADVPIEFDEVAMSPHFRYEKDGRLHEVWFEDVRSYREKFSLLPSYGLRGMGYWQIMRFFRPNWLLLEDTFQIERS